MGLGHCRYNMGLGPMNEDCGADPKQRGNEVKERYGSINAEASNGALRR